jgi:hypothetical protein
MENNVDTFYEERNYLAGFIFIRVYDNFLINHIIGGQLFFSSTSRNEKISAKRGKMFLAE